MPSGRYATGQAPVDDSTPSERLCAEWAPMRRVGVSTLSDGSYAERATPRRVGVHTRASLRRATVSSRLGVPAPSERTDPEWAFLLRVKDATLNERPRAEQAPTRRVGVSMPSDGFHAERATLRRVSVYTLSGRLHAGWPFQAV